MRLSVFLRDKAQLSPGQGDGGCGLGRRAPLRLPGSPGGHSQRGHDQPGPSPPTRTPSRPRRPEPSSQPPTLQDPAEGAGREPGGRTLRRYPPGPAPTSAPTPPGCRALPGRRRPRLTRVLATFPLWVMFLLCFSLAIRIRCLATMACAL